MKLKHRRLILAGAALAGTALAAALVFQPASLDDWKTLFELIFYAGALIAAVWAVYVYQENAALERARWVSSLYERFYQQDALKEVRDLLDTPGIRPKPRSW